MELATTHINQDSVKIQFSRGNRSLFITRLRNQVNAHFRENQKDRYGDKRIVFKMFLLGSSLILAYGLILSNWFSPLQMALLAVFWGFAMTLFVLNVGHEAAHGTFSANPRVNRLLTYSWDFFGMSSYVWILRHNASHHGFANVHGTDLDLKSSSLLRMDPNDAWKKHHRWQHLYAPFLYANFGVFAIFIRDFKMLGQHRFGNRKVNKHGLKTWLTVILGKVWFLTYTLLIPLLVLELSGWQVLLGFYIMLLSASIYAAMILIPPHLNDGNQFPVPSSEGMIEGCRAKHELATTIDCAAGSSVAAWFSGGLNTHVLHHLFPHISHIHHQELTPILKKTAADYGLEYRNYSFPQILKAHFAHLRNLGSCDRAGEMKIDCRQ